MSQDVGRDRLVVVKVAGIHCHNCEERIRKTLSAKEGVREVEVDFNSGQASVLFDPTQVTIRDLMDGIDEAGYKATGFTQPAADAMH
jgi:P-type Cu+ transporter